MSNYASSHIRELKRREKGRSRVKKFVEMYELEETWVGGMGLVYIVEIV